jgi:hypothetical protein
MQVSGCVWHLHGTLDLPGAMGKWPLLVVVASWVLAAASSGLLVATACSAHDLAGGHVFS